MARPALSERETFEEPQPVLSVPKGFSRKWALIKLHPRQDEHQINDVVLCHNGHNIALQRNQWVPVNWSYVECLRHAAHPRFSQEPGKARIKIGTTERFPFQGPYEITPEQVMQFKAILSNGSEIMESDITKITGLSV